MKLPSTVRIGPYKFKIVRSNRDDHDEAGYFLSAKREIGVAKPEDFGAEDEEAATVIHELAHAVVDVYWPQIEEDEEIVSRLDPIVTQILRDNKALVRSILKALK